MEEDYAEAEDDDGAGGGAGTSMGVSQLGQFATVPTSAVVTARRWPQCGQANLNVTGAATGVGCGSGVGSSGG